LVLAQSAFAAQERTLMLQKSTRMQPAGGWRGSMLNASPQAQLALPQRVFGRKLRA
jgi:hypothetical protein